ncbi:MAG: glycosyltransferase [Chloroflexota bacterium]
MRILYFTRSDSPHDQRFLAAISGSGYEVYALRLEAGSQAPITPPGVTEVEWKACQRDFRFSDLLRVLPRLKKLIKQIQPDLIHAGPIQSAAFLAAATGFKPLLSMSWGYDILRDVERGRIWRWVTNYTLKHSDRLAVDCETVAEKAERLGYARDRMILFPWGVDLEYFSLESGAVAAEKWRREMGWEKHFVILGLRAWEPIYGMDVLARAFVLAAQKEPGLRLAMLGHGSQAHEIYRILTEGRVSDRVFFGGRVGYNDLPGYYCGADLYISPSHIDGSSVSLMEALACGRPALVSDIPSNREWIKPGKTGWLFKDGNIQSLADAMLSAYHSKMRTKMQLAARQVAINKANWSKNFQILRKAYEVLENEYKHKKL